MRPVLGVAGVTSGSADGKLGALGEPDRCSAGKEPSGRARLRVASAARPGGCGSWAPGGDAYAPLRGCAEQCGGEAGIVVVSTERGWRPSFPRRSRGEAQSLHSGDSPHRRAAPQTQRGTWSGGRVGGESAVSSAAGKPAQRAWRPRVQGPSCALGGSPDGRGTLACPSYSGSVKGDCQFFFYLPVESRSPIPHLLEAGWVLATPVADRLAGLGPGASGAWLEAGLHLGLLEPNPVAGAAGQEG